jgi:hypothetical protein
MLLRAEPGKQKPRSCRMQELARSSGPRKERQKKAGLPASTGVGMEQSLQQRENGREWAAGFSVHRKNGAGATVTG